MKKIDNSDALMFGISANHEIMDNDEMRFRLISGHGSSYILTKSGHTAYWQKAHLHQMMTELYLVEKGSAIIVIYENERYQLKRLYENESLMIKPGVAHNLYIFEDSIIHTVKYGALSNDWHSYPELDEICQKLDLT